MKKLLSFLIAAIMILSLVPVSFAEDGADEPVYEGYDGYDDGGAYGEDEDNDDADRYNDYTDYDSAMLYGDNLTWSFNSDTGVLTISGTGDMADYSDGLVGSPWTNYYDRTVRLVVEEGVTSIGARAFEGFSVMRTMTLPSTLTHIDYEAFYGCVSLETVAFPASFEIIGPSAFERCRSLDNVVINAGIQVGPGAFEDCTSLSSLVISDGVTTIGSRAFSGCSALTEVHIPASVTSMDGAFYQCASIETFTIDAGNVKYYCLNNCVINRDRSAIVLGFGAASIPQNAGITTIDEYAFYGSEIVTANIPATVTSLGNYALSNCAELRAVVFPDAMQTLPEGVLSDCPKLQGVHLPEGMTSGGIRIFMRCPSLELITIPAGLTEIPQSMFYDCSSLRVVTYEGTVTSIGGSAFSGCKSLPAINIGAAVQSIGGGAFTGCSSVETITVDPGNTRYISSGNCLIDPETATVMRGCNNSVIPDDGSVTTLGATSFYGVNSASIYVPDSITTMDNSVFAHCNYLTSVRLPANITSIGAYTFAACPVLEEITIPASVTQIGGGAFKDCTALRTVNLNEGLKSIGGYQNCTSLEELNIPSSVTYISPYDFTGCTALRTVTVAEGCEKYFSSGNCIVERATGTLVYGCAGCAIPTDGSVTKIGRSAFEGNTALETVYIPGTVTAIEGAAFKDCTSLYSVLFSDGIEQIGVSAFENCTSLETVALPASVTSLCGVSFKNSGVKDVYIQTGLTLVDVGAFDGTPVENVYYTGTEAERYANITIEGKLYFTYAYNGVNDTFINADWHYNFTHEHEWIRFVVTPATYTEAGLLRRVCKYCGETIEEPIAIIVAEGQCGDNLRWVLGDDGTLTVSGTGAMGNYAPWNSYKDQILKVVVEEGVTSIGNDTFKNCANLTEVSLPEGLIKIGDNAFRNCPQLDGMYIPGSVTYIGEDAYWGDSVFFGKLEGNVTLKKYALYGIMRVYFLGPKEDYNKLKMVEYVNDATMEYYHDLILASVYGGSGVLETNPPGNGTEWRLDYKTGTLYVTGEGKVFSLESHMGGNSYALVKNVVIGDDVTEISTDAFNNGNSIESVIIGDSVTKIGIRAFEGCTNLESVSISEHSALATISLSAFNSCRSLASVYIPTSVNKIEKNAFYGCRALKDVYFEGTPGDYLSANVVAEGNERLLKAERHYSENKCGNDLTWTKDGGVLTITGSGAMYNFSGGFLSPWYYDETITEVVIPEGIATIPQNAFYGCTGLTSLTLPNSVRYIQSNAFNGCTGLTEITVPKKTVYVAESAFNGCTGVTSVTIPATVTSLGTNAFANCTSLTDVYYYGTEDDWYGLIPNNEYLLDVNVHFIEPDPCDAGHTWGVGVTTLLPTYTVQGEVTYTCIVCGATYVEYTPVKPPLSGDTDGDGVITVRDLPSIKKALTGGDSTTVLVNCDIDGDGRLTLKDVAALKKMIAGQ